MAPAALDDRLDNYRPAATPGSAPVVRRETVGCLGVQHRRMVASRDRGELCHQPRPPRVVRAEENARLTPTLPRHLPRLGQPCQLGRSPHQVPAGPTRSIAGSGEPTGDRSWDPAPGSSVPATGALVRIEPELVGRRRTARAGERPGRRAAGPLRIALIRRPQARFSPGCSPTSRSRSPVAAEVAPDSTCVSARSSHAVACDSTRRVRSWTANSLSGEIAAYGEPRHMANASVSTLAAPVKSPVATRRLPSDVSRSKTSASTSTPSPKPIAARRRLDQLAANSGQ